MKRAIYNRLIKAGLLLILFLYPSVVKSFHISHEQLCISNNGSHDDNDCPVCQFHYTTYIEAELFEIEIIPLCLSFEKSFCNEKEYDTSLFSYFLRGPPLFSAGQ
jgi:hypothetical protein